MMELWPFTNFHDINLDWIIRRIKNIEDSEAASKASELAAKASEEAAADSAQSASDSADLAAGSAEAAGDSAQTLAHAIDQITVNTSRIDAWTTEQTPDANTELLDERVEFTGFTNASAGDATRAQGALGFKKLGQILFNGFEPVDTTNVTAGYYNWNGTISTAGSSTKEVYTAKVPVKHGEAFLIVNEIPAGSSPWIAAGVFNSSDTWVTRLQFASGTDSASQLYTTAAEDGRNLYYGLFQPAVNANAATVSFCYRTYGTAGAMNIYRIPLSKINGISTTLTPIILGDSTSAKIIAIDTATHTVTIPGDTLLLWPDTYPNHMSETPTQNTNTGYRQLSTANNPITLSYDNVTPPGQSNISSALVGVYNSLLKQVSIITYDNPLVYSPYTAVIFTLRWKPGQDAVSFACSAPYSINGNLYGIAVNQSTAADPWRFTPVVDSVNHRGFNSVAPENTLPAFKLSKVNGFDMIECDLQLTSDKVPVVIHDGSINRTARNLDGTTISGTVNVNSTTYQDLYDNYDFGIWKGAAYAGTHIPTWAELCELARALGLKIYCELKTETTWTQADVTNVVNTALQCGLEDKLVFISSSYTYLGYCRTAAPSVPRYSVEASITSTNITNASNVGAGLDVNYSNVTAANLALAKQAGIPVAVWTVDSASDIVNMDPYIEAVTSNTLIAAKELYDANI